MTDNPVRTLAAAPLYVETEWEAVLDEAVLLTVAVVGVVWQVEQ